MEVIRLRKSKQGSIDKCGHSFWSRKITQILMILTKFY